MSELRTTDKADFFDAIIMQLDSSGAILRYISVTQGGLQFDLISSQNALLQVTIDSAQATKALFFSGTSLGYNTAEQAVYTGEQSYIYKLQFGDSLSPCILTASGDNTGVLPVWTTTTEFPDELAVEMSDRFANATLTQDDFIFGVFS